MEAMTEEMPTGPGEYGSVMEMAVEVMLHALGEVDRGNWRFDEDTMEFVEDVFYLGHVYWEDMVYPWAVARGLDPGQVHECLTLELLERGYLAGPPDPDIYYKYNQKGLLSEIMRLLWDGLGDCPDEYWPKYRFFPPKRPPEPEVRPARFDSKTVKRGGGLGLYIPAKVAEKYGLREGETYPVSIDPRCVTK